MGLLKTIMQISGVITSIMALFYLRLSHMKPLEIINRYPEDNPIIAKIKFLGFVNQFLKTAIFSTFTIIFGFGSLWFLLNNNKQWFDILFLLANSTFIISLILILMYFLTQREIIKEQKEKIQP